MGNAVDPAIIIALIALAGSLVSTVAAVFGAPALQARREAKVVLESYREPLLAAAYELQARLHNILCNKFLERYVLDNEEIKQDAALKSTLFVFAQFFAWREVIRQEIQFLRFPRDEDTRQIQGLLRDVEEAFLQDDLGDQFMIWRVEQRGLGERMITTSNGKPRSLGYSAFIKKRATMQEWLEPLESDLKNLQKSGRNRLTKVQHLLLDLVRRLDSDQTRYPAKMEKA